MRYFIIVFLAISISILPKDNNKIKKSAGEPSYKRFNINNISTFIRNNGESDINPNGSSGFEFPKGSGKHVVFQSGLVWGAKVNGQVRIGGSTYRQSTVPGKILNSGVDPAQLTAENPDAPHVRTYRVRPDHKNGDLSSEIADGEGTEAEIRAAYQKDWNEWPAADGAPYSDIDNNGVYNPEVDIPGIPGADQTLWFVCNDTDPDQTHFLYGTPPMGIEEQVTIWGYKNPLYSNVIFRKYKLVNKSNLTFDDMYISMWSDSDIGYMGDDFAGCDSLLNLGYTYNGSIQDAVYNFQPPAAGFKLLNIPMAAFSYFSCGNSPFCEPSLGVKEGAEEFYSYMQGKVSSTGQYFVDPNTGSSTTYMVPGDPVKNEGWVDGQFIKMGDRTFILSSEPFQLQPGSSKEVVAAELASMGTDRINSVKILKNQSKMVQFLYDNSFQSNALPPAPSEIEISASYGENIQLTWGNNAETFDQDGYQFQGYNVYQLYDQTPLKEAGKKIAVFDKVDGIKTIIFNSDTLQAGNDSGIEHSYTVTQDALENYNLVKGKKYFFAVTAYSYNSNSLKIPATESLLNTFIINFQDTLPGPFYGNKIAVDHLSGNGDAVILPSVYDPSKLTGSDYEVFFEKNSYYRNIDGDWVPVNSGINKSLKKTNDLSGSYLNAAAVYGEQSNTIKLKFILNLLPPNGSFADGILFTFPSPVTVLDALTCNAGGGNVTPVVNSASNTVLYGNNNSTQFGIFQGNEEINIIVQSGELPFKISYIIYDDGYSTPVLNSEGEVIIDSIGFEYKTQNEWNLVNITNNDTLLKNMTVINDYDLYTHKYVCDPIVEGIKLSVNPYYDPPANYKKAFINRAPGSSTAFSATFGYPISDGISLSNYTVFFGTPSSKAIDIFATGTNDFGKLQQDYELRFTGIENTTINGNNTLITVASGGQMATIFSTQSGPGGLADHPLNPNPGSTDPFLIRIPFEVWNIDDPAHPYQVNLAFRDRSQAYDNGVVYGWNDENRMYAVIINSPYDGVTPTPLNDDATWVIVFWSTHWNVGDKVIIEYPNQIKFGADKFTFSTRLPLILPVENERVLDSYKLYQNYPNPFNPETKIRFSLAKSGLTEIIVFDILGRQVTTILNKDLKKGTHEISFNGSNLSSGVYFYRIKAGDFMQTKKMLLIK